MLASSGTGGSYFIPDNQGEPPDVADKAAGTALGVAQFVCAP